MLYYIIYKIIVVSGCLALLLNIVIEIDFLVLTMIHIMHDCLYKCIFKFNVVGPAAAVKPGRPLCRQNSSAAGPGRTLSVSAGIYFSSCSLLVSISRVLFHKTD